LLHIRTVVVRSVESATRPRRHPSTAPIGGWGYRIDRISRANSGVSLCAVSVSVEDRHALSSTTCDPTSEGMSAPSVFVCRFDALPSRVPKRQNGMVPVETVGGAITSSHGRPVECKQTSDRRDKRAHSDRSASPPRITGQNGSSTVQNANAPSPAVWEVWFRTEKLTKSRC
jgi:hypothetical protein